MEKREGTVVNKNQGTIKDKRNKQNIKAENPGNVPINDNDEITYISYVSSHKNAQKVVHVIKDKKG